ncbi:rhomboid family intramembrane serine protease [bacterium]|nr:MAG: rhomboid family intramembrane serine protease [bacterium]
MLTALLPIGDDNSDRVIQPYITYALIAINILVFVLLQLPSDYFTYAYSVVPKEILTGVDLVKPKYIPELRGAIPQAPGPSPIYLTILSAMFMHGGWAHLGGNMLYLWIFGDNVEDAMGHVKFLIFYLLCGLIATLAHVFAANAAGGVDVYIPSLGASGAIAGVLGAYLVLFPRKNVHVLVGWFGLISVPAFIVIGGWIALQLFSGVSREFITEQTRSSGGGVAYWAHVGGAVAGLILVWIFRNPQVRQRADSRAQGYPSNFPRY